ncbi:MAG: DUF1932 domain-containing protein [SAR324 cluster bacterium]|nr:DUF1932 domain-containing protein [SAR324 cluster bacterium]MCZ6629367.1 DUF1932 domain-containing protein [SAR324 cluster bacterium]MCZ6645448.1 DUF1932 domain-containing protein [SAR324 cluster bacterium]
MKIETVGIYSPGEMGQAIGEVLRNNGLRVVAALEGRSERTRELAAAAGIEDVGSLQDLVRAADLVLSILVPSNAAAAAREVAAALRASKAELLYADCNAISPQSTIAVGAIIEEAGGMFVDGSIIGPPPRKPGATRLYVSGAHAEAVAQLNCEMLEVPVVGTELGQASGLKMCYAGLTKGTMALATEVLLAARMMNLEGHLRKEFETSQQVMLGWMERQMPGMPPKAHRFVGEMEEIAATYERLGMTPHIQQGAAEMYRAVATTRLGKESPEQRDGSRGLDDVIGMLAADLGKE